MPLNGKLSQWKKVVTVEPLIAICVLVASIRGIIQEQFESSYFKQEDKWPHHGTLIQTVQSTVPIILALFCGSYSDQTNRRRPFLLLPILGETAALFGYTLCKLLKNQCCQWINTFLCCVPSIFGGENMLYMAALALITDINKPSTISFHVGILYMVEYTGVLLGIIAKEIYSKAHWVLVTGSGGYLLLALLYVLFCVEEVKPTVSDNPLVNVMRPKYLIESATFLLRNYVGKQRAYFLILLHLISTYYLANFGGSFGLLQLAEVSSGHYWIFLATLWIGTLAVIPLFTKNLVPLRDTTILIISCVAQIFSNILIGVGNVEILYLALVISILVVLIAVVSTSMVLKLALPTDFAKLAVMVTIFKSSGVSFAFMTHGILNRTSFKFTHFGATLFAILLPLVVWVHIAYKKEVQQDRRANTIGNNQEEFEARQI